jgi:hypothetical protein
MTSHERFLRNSQVVRERARGLGWAEISARFGLSDRQARRVVAEYRESRPHLHELDPIEIIEEALLQHDAAIEDLALLAQTTSHDGTKLGAIKGRLEALRAKLELMAAVGVLPRDLRRLQIEVDIRHVAQAILDVFAAYDVPHEVQRAVVEAVESRNAGSPPNQSIAASKNGANC